MKKQSIMAEHCREAFGNEAAKLRKGDMMAFVVLEDILMEANEQAPAGTTVYSFYFGRCGTSGLWMDYAAFMAAFVEPGFKKAGIAIHERSTYAHVVALFGSEIDEGNGMCHDLNQFILTVLRDMAHEKPDLEYVAIVISEDD